MTQKNQNIIVFFYMHINEKVQPRHKCPAELLLLEYSADSEVRVNGVHVVKHQHIRNLRMLIDK